MHILFITHKYPPVIGGMEKQSYELTTRIGPEHTVFLHAYKGEGSKLRWFFSLKKSIKKLLHEHPEIDMIHLNDGLMASATTWLKKYTDIPIVATIHGLDITFPSSIFQKRIVPKLQHLDGVICVSRATAEACLERGFLKDKVFTVLNGVDHDLAEMPIDKGQTLEKLKKEKGIDLAGKKIIATMGRAVKRKGFSWFLKNVVPALDEDVVFLMIGPLNTNPGLGEKWMNLLPSASRSKLELMLGIATDVEAIVEALESEHTKNKVFHLGKVPFKDLMQYLALADIFVMPNIKVKGDAEGFGLVALEASLRGTPVLAAGIEGITDAVRDGKNGVLLPSGRPEEWINAIHHLLNDPAKLASLSISAVDTTIADYGWDKMVTEYLDVFDSIKSKGL